MEQLQQQAQTWMACVVALRQMARRPLCTMHTSCPALTCPRSFSRLMALQKRHSRQYSTAEAAIISCAAL
jgi:hypothetical protein